MESEGRTFAILEGWARDANGKQSAPDLTAWVAKPLPPEPKGRERIVVWKSDTEVERIKLYRRVWGPSWSPASFRVSPAAPDRRDELIRQHMIVVEKIAGKLVAQGQNPGIQRDDLLVVGYEKMIHTIDLPPADTLPLDKKIARNCRTAMIRFIKEEFRERRYALQGWAKATRAAREVFGFRSSERCMREEGRAAETADQSSEDAEQAAQAGRQPMGEFLYRDWLHGAPIVFRKTRAYHADEIHRCDLPEALAEIAHGIGYHFKPVEDDDSRFPFGPRDYMRPAMKCLRPTTQEEYRKYLEAWAEMLRARPLLKPSRTGTVVHLATATSSNRRT